MNFKSSLKKIWEKATAAFAVPEPVNAMDTDDVHYITQKVRAKTPFNVGCMDTRMVNVRKNVGLIMSVTTPEAEAVKAEDIFIAAARDRGLEITRDKILRYVPGTITRPSRFVQPPPQTWQRPEN